MRGRDRIGGGHDGYSEITLHWQTDADEPRAELTLWADLNDSDRPVVRVSFPAGFEPRLPEPHQAANAAASESAPAHPHDTVTSSSVVCLGSTGLPLVEPDSPCEACDTQGTVGRAIRYTSAGDIDEMHRFCAECWPEQRARLAARWQHQDTRALDAHRRSGATGGWSGMSSAFESATWDAVAMYIDGLRAHAMTRGRAAQHDLRQLADQLFDTRQSRVGEMPFEVESFIRQHASRLLPPDFPGG